MKGQIIDNSLYTHEKAVIEEWRRNSNSRGYCCERHGSAQREEALKVLNSLRVVFEANRTREIARTIEIAIMREETIGDSIFTKADGKEACGVGIRRHGKVVLNEQRTSDTYFRSYCKPHAAIAKREAKAHEVRMARQAARK